MNCVDCIGSDLPAMIYKCSDNQYRCYMHQKVFDGLLTECPTKERGALDLVPIPESIKDVLRQMAAISSTTKVDITAGLTPGTTDRILNKNIKRISCRILEQLQSVASTLHEGIIPSEARVTVTPEMRNKLRKLKDEYTCTQIANKTGLQINKIYLILKGTRKTVTQSDYEAITNAQLDDVDKYIILTKGMRQKIAKLKGEYTANILADKIGVAKTSVNSWARGERKQIRESTWKRIKEC